MTAFKQLRYCYYLLPNNIIIRKQTNKFMNIKLFSSKTKPNVNLDEDVDIRIKDELLKAKHHPGRIKQKVVTLPEKLIKAMINVLEDHPEKTVIEDCKVLERHLNCRSPPVENRELKNVKRTLRDKILAKESISNKNYDNEERLEQVVKDKVQHKLRHFVYNWKPINYNSYNCLLYLFARFSPEYAALVRIFLEISIRDSEFQPKSFFDFGSGTGTATWAAKLYWNKIFEYFNVDSSRDMNDLAQLLLQGGRGTKLSDIKGTFYRQFLPANNVSYDLVVCAYTLLELPSSSARLQTILNLWNKTSGYLVVVEHGSNAGFKVLNEVRDFILSISNENNKGHVFSPCPHDTVCPRFLTDNVPCKFEVSYMPHPITGPLIHKKERFSYVVLKKGERSKDDVLWPRIVTQPLHRSKHTICRMCTSAGKLEEVIFTASRHGKSAYRCARSSNWGDRLPITIDNNDKGDYM